MTLTVAVACAGVSTVLYPLFSGLAWFYAGIGAVIAVAASGAVSRLRVLPAGVCLAISVLGLLVYLNLVFEARYSWLRVIPTPNSIARLGDLAAAGMADASKYAPPAPNVPGLVLLAAAGIGVTAVLTDLIAVRMRSTALAGLPLLVLFTVPVTMRAPGGAGVVIVFCLGAAGYLAMLSADGRERIRVWGSLVSLWRHGSLDDTAARRGPDTRALAAAGRRVGLASVVLALCVPLILPGLHASKLFSSGPGIGGTGSSGSSGGPALPDALAQTIGQLKQSHPTEVLTYTASAPKRILAAYPLYLQQYVLDKLTDTGWQTTDYWAGSVQVVTSMPPPEGLGQLSSLQQVAITVSVASDALADRSAPTFLPMPYPPVLVTTPPGIWLADPDLMVFSRAGSAAVTSYAAASDIVDPAPRQLNAAPAPSPSAELAPDLELPSSYKTAALADIAKQVTKGQTTEFQKVNALATWLSSPPFSYSSAAPVFSNADGLLEFLTRTKAGVCVQYAWAMTALTRLLGIPARMVQGFTGGTAAAGGQYVVKTSDAHAWPEVFFSGFGWIRFEPTPAGGDGTAQAPGYQGHGPGTGGSTSNIILPPVGPASSPSTHPAVPGSGLKPIPDEGGPEAGLPGRSAGTPWGAIVLAVAAAIALAWGVIAIAAPPAHRALARNPADPARRRRPVTLAMAVLVMVAAAVVMLALYRLLSHTSGLDVRAGWETVGIAFGAAGLAMLVLPAVSRVAIRRWRWLHAGDDVALAHTAWREFRDDLEDLGVGCLPSEPPRTLAGRVSSGLPERVGAAIRRLALAEERACYAARPSESATLRRDGAVARRGIAASAGRGSRWRARVFPASVMTALAGAAARVPDRAAALVSRRWAERRSVS